MLLFFYISKNPTPRLLAILSALNTSIALLLFLLIIKLFNWINLSYIWIFGLFTFNFCTSFISMEGGLRLFIYRKIKLIYKAIHKIKAPKTDAPLAIDMRNHIIDKVEKEVVAWAKGWTQEIHFLKQAEQFRREFIGNVSHELKTPIFNMQGYLYTILENDMEEALQQKYLSKAVENVERMATIVEDLSEISRLEAGEIKLEMQTFDITELCAEVMDELETLANPKQIRLEFKDEINTVKVQADRNRIRQVLNNLVSNAIKYSPEKTLILAAFYDLDANILIEISDNGTGIAEEHLPRLFERFYRVDKARTRAAGGSGLGLAIVKHIIEAHLQTLNVRSRVGVGSTFGFTLAKGKK